MQEPKECVTLNSDKCKLALKKSVVHSFVDVQRTHSFDTEQGGILVGYYDALFDGIIICDITYPQKNDVCEKYRYLRKSSGHQDIMDELWIESGYRKCYLGEWHTHNQKHPNPSWIDKNNWKSIAKREHNFNSLFFVIVGTNEFAIWGISDKSTNGIFLIGRVDN